jgi:hypothetical protein
MTAPLWRKVAFASLIAVAAGIGISFLVLPYGLGWFFWRYSWDLWRLDSCFRNISEKEISMSNHIYTKTVLTIIAVALTMIALNPWFAPPKVEAASDSVATAILPWSLRSEMARARILKYASLIRLPPRLPSATA